MSERGVFAVDRGIWEHDLLLEDAPFSRREAWLWLVSEAAWKPHRRRLIGRAIELQRGQIVASLRFIASKWRWSEPRVRRFLSALISEQMVDAKTDAGVTVITICKYDEYQRVSLPSDAMPEIDGDAGATQERRKVEGKEYKEEDRNEKNARARGTRLAEGSLLSTENRYFAAAAGIPEAEIDRVWAEFVDYWIALPGQRGIKTKWDATWRNRVRQLTPWKGRTNGRPQTTGSVIQAADDLLERVRAFDRPAPSQSRIFSGAGASPIRAIPKG